MSDITWKNETRKLGDLLPWEYNPKVLPERAADGLRVSIQKFGFAVPLLIDPDGEIIDGNQRAALMALMDEYGPDAVVDVRVASRKLTWDERRELVVRLKENQADWDEDLLADLYEPDELLAWGMDDWRLRELLGDDIDQADLIEQRDDSGNETGHLLKAVRLVLDEPDAKVQYGDTYALGRHRLVIRKIITEWPHWIEFLEEGMLLTPYAGPSAVLSTAARKHGLLIIQPDVYIAGHIIDAFRQAFPNEKVLRL